MRTLLPIAREREREREGGKKPKGSTFGIEGIVSSCGLVLGKMGHNERYTANTLVNTVGRYDTMIFKNAVNYIRGE